MALDKKTIQKRRMMSYFINATYDIIKEKGVENVTIRDVADVAGYNSATLYNYFEDLEHLIFYASLRYLKDYTDELQRIVNVDNSLERLIKIWECFCFHSFANPKIYNSIFFGKHSKSLNNDIEEYYSIFPEQLGEQREDVKSMLLGQNIYERNKTILETCVDEGFIREENLEDLNEMIVLIYHGMLSKILGGFCEYDVEEAKDKTIVYIKQAIISYEGKVFE